jgi:LmbE family N-acetylglucosaminyl deacetylase
VSVTRREMLTGGGKLAVGLAAGMPGVQSMADSQPPKSPSGGKLKFIVCGGHPGDPEYGCGGTIARLTSSGHDVSLLYLNEGDWPPTPATVRLAEAKKACDILKTQRLYAGQMNGRAVVDTDHYDQYRKILEREKPDGVFTQWPLDNHRDHRACYTLTYDAWQRMGKRFSLYYYEVSSGEDTLQFSPGFYADITEYEPVKRAACYAHASQTPDRYYALQDSVATFRGLESGYKRAEGFLLQRESARDVLPLALGAYRNEEAGRPV